MQHLGHCDSAQDLEDQHLFITDGGLGPGYACVLVREEASAVRMGISFAGVCRRRGWQWDAS